MTEACERRDWNMCMHVYQCERKLQSIGNIKLYDTLIGCNRVQ